ncbi:MAG: TlpA disulfide reductase family protein [Bacteroidota bacterium]
MIQEISGKEKKGNIVYKVKNLELPKGMYFIGKDEKALQRMMWLGDESMKFAGHCDSIPTTKMVEGTGNDRYNYYLNKTSELQNQFSQQIMQIRRAMGNPQALENIKAEFGKIDDAKVNLLAEAATEDDYWRDFVSLWCYLSFQHNQGDYKDEPHYFAGEYLARADLSSENFDRIPVLLDMARGYAQNLARVGLPLNEQRDFAQAVLTRTKPGTARHKTLLFAFTNGFQAGKQETLFVEYAEQFTAAHGEAYPNIAKNIETAISKYKRLMVGSVAPGIVQPTPEGASFDLNSLRGKVVLLDFWASWCGPCRRENPNVVKVYNQYKDQGFEILGISLDNSKDRWVKAIAQDQLTWVHVSDLKKWSSAVARDYNVSSIPATYLLDREGKILAKNLRGAALENKLAEVFSE